MGNGLANVIAALIVAAAILLNGVLDGRIAPAGLAGVPPATEDDFREWYARAVGDIRNDIVVNCGCCGENKPGF
ncbi:MAG: hypothetical protein HXY23_05000 [Parvularculaceae bacterium]|nr:hypothetical protein [Parvularculaceae bacterium]